MNFFKHTKECRDSAQEYSQFLSSCGDCGQLWAREPGQNWKPVDEDGRQVWPKGRNPFAKRRR